MAGTGPEPVQDNPGTRRSLWLAYALRLVAAIGSAWWSLRPEVIRGGNGGKVSERTLGMHELMLQAVR